MASSQVLGNGVQNVFVVVLGSGETARLMAADSWVQSATVLGSNKIARLTLASVGGVDFLLRAEGQRLSWARVYFLA